MRKQQVLLYSAGMDSLIASHVFPNALKLYVQSGSRYEAKEIAHIHATHKPGEVVFDKRLDLSDIERDDAIVPARNLLFATVASLYGNHIVLGAVQGDNSTDKDYEFATRLTGLLGHIYSPPHFPVGLMMKIDLPMKFMSKVGWVKWYAKQGHNLERLLLSVSCYHPTDLYCGRCKPCIRKWIAQEANGLVGTPWKEHPAGYDWKQHIPAIKARTWRCPEEDTAAEQVLHKHNIL